MKRYEIRHVYTNDVLSSVEAETPLAALDAYAVAEGFVPYSELPQEEDEFGQLEDRWTFTIPDGVLAGSLAGTFTNYAIAAIEVTR